MVASRTPPRDVIKTKSVDSITLPFVSQLPPDKRVAHGDFGPLVEPQFRDVLANQLGRGVVLLDQGGTLRAAADRFQPQGPRAGEEIDGVFPRMSGPIRLKIASRRRSFIGRVRRSPL